MKPLFHLARDPAQNWIVVRVHRVNVPFFKRFGGLSKFSRNVDQPGALDLLVEESGERLVTDRDEVLRGLLGVEGAARVDVADGQLVVREGTGRVVRMSHAEGQVVLRVEAYRSSWNHERSHRVGSLGLSSWAELNPRPLRETVLSHLRVSSESWSPWRVRPACSAAGAWIDGVPIPRVRVDDERDDTLVADMRSTSGQESRDREITMAQAGKIEVAFLHPRDSREFKAEIGGGTTGQKAIDELVKAGFIDAPSANAAYALQLQRTGKSIPLSSPFAAAGVQTGDLVAVTETSAGATA